MHRAPPPAKMLMLYGLPEVPEPVIVTLVPCWISPLIVVTVAALPILLKAEPSPEKEVPLTLPINISHACVGLTEPTPTLPLT